VKTVGGSYLTLRPLARLPPASFMTVQTPRARPSARIPVVYRRRAGFPPVLLHCGYLPVIGSSGS
jgi:hypothetical protein